MTIKAIIFDFDGLILDTETSDYLSWQAVYASFGCELPLAMWQEHIGSVDSFNPYLYLEQLLGGPIDRTAVHDQRKLLDQQLLAQQTIMPGVLDYLTDAKRLGLKIGLASSSAHSWVDGYLIQLGIVSYFDIVCCRDDVGHVSKPDPTVYLAAIDGLAVAPHEALALEDSANGALAAQRAGLYCVAIPNQMTQGLSFGPISYRLNSLADMPLAQLLAKIGP